MKTRMERKKKYDEKMNTRTHNRMKKFKNAHFFPFLRIHISVKTVLKSTKWLGIVQTHETHKLTGYRFEILA